MPYFEFDRQLRPVGPGVLTIGSGPEAGWRIHNRNLAPVHLVVSPTEGGKAMVVRGTPDAKFAVNGKDVTAERHTLAFGDKLRIGTAEFTFRQTAHGSGDAAYLRDMRRARVFKLADVSLIGRDPRCLVLLTEPSVSRVHAEVRAENGRFRVSPIGTAYTAVNHHALIEPTELSEGDELSIGDTVLRFTTEVLPNVRTAVPDQNPPTKSRSARMATVFVGAVEARERLRQNDNRKLAAIVTAGLALAGTIGMLIAG